MTPEAALIELLARLGAAHGSAILVSAADLADWPAEAVAAMRSQHLVRKARPAATVVCPGCEEACAMPVNTLPAGVRKASWFVVCDKRDDINRVRIPASELEQWRADPEAVCEFVSEDLGIRRSGQPDPSAGLLAIGVATGAKRSQMLCLLIKGEPTLVAGGGRLPLADVVRFEGGSFSVDWALIRHLVDSSTSADPRYTPSNLFREVRKRETEARHNAWQRAYRELRKNKPGMSGVWYSRQIAKSDAGAGCEAETIRKHMKR